MNQKTTSPSSTFTEDFRSLFSYLQGIGEDDNFFEMNYDYLSMAMPEFIASDTFSKLPGERRKELFFQYDSLKSLLNVLADFVKAHPSKMETNKSEFRDIVEEVGADGRPMG